MAMGNTLATQVAVPQINTMQNFQASQANAQNMKMAKQQEEAAAFEQFATIGLGVMDGNPDGAIDPAKLEQALSLFGDSPIAAKIKENPELLRTITKNSMNVLQFVRDGEKFELAKKQFEVDLANSQAPKQPDVPSGYRLTTDGSAMEAYPGGPADPANPLNEKKLVSDERKLTAAETKELFDAQDAVTAGEAAVPMLEKMVELNKTAWDGPLADAGTSVGALAGDKNSVDTQELKNLTTAQALEQLKAVFGSMPTEGERKILLEIQGAVTQQRDVRQRIFDRAIAAAKRRIDANRAKAESIQTGSYKQPGGGPSAPAGASAEDQPVTADGEVVSWDELDWGTD